MKIFSQLIASVVLLPTLAFAEGPEPGTATGTITVNDEPVALRHAYVYREAEGFYDPADPTWSVLITAEPVAPRDIDDFFIDPSLRLKLTLTSEFSDSPSLEILSQNLLIGDFSHSGGEPPLLELEQQGPEIFAGRIHLAEPRTFFDDSYHYDLSFHALPADPNAPIGEALPEGGGEPGAAYRAWVSALHTLDIDAIRTLVTPDMAQMLDDPEAAEQLEFLASMTPTDVRILGGSSDDNTAILQVEGSMDGETVAGDVTMERHGELWIWTSGMFE